MDALNIAKEYDSTQYIVIQIGEEQYGIDIKYVDKKRNKDGKKYYACDRCENSEKAYVYITPYGNRYHGDPECSNLKVLVRKIPKSEMGDRKLCYFCE